MNPLLELSSNHKYKIVKLLSSGKFGKSWMGECTQSERVVVIKETKISDEFKFLISTFNKLPHPAISSQTEILDAGEKQYLIREYQHGTCLKEILLKQKLRKKPGLAFWTEAFAFLLEGLNELHNANIIHRDIKPSNIIICHSPLQKPAEWLPEQIKLIDFELSVKIPVTVNNSISPFALGYASPEQVLNCNKLLCPGSDIYATGIAVYETLTGNKPFNFYDPEMMMHLQLNAPLPYHTGMPNKLFEVLRNATAKEPFRLPPRNLSKEEIFQTLESGIVKRYSNCLQFAQALREAQTAAFNKTTNPLKKLFNKFY
jgi:serine/threonine protein kinase